MGLILCSSSRNRWPGSSNISGSTFDSNTADHSSGQGGALSLNFNGAAAIANSTFHNNSAFAGGAIYTNSNSTTLTNATLSGNTAYTSLGGGGIYGYVSGPVLQNVILWGDKDSGGSSSNEIGQSISRTEIERIATLHSSQVTARSPCVCADSPAARCSRSTDSTSVVMRRISIFFDVFTRNDFDLIRAILSVRGSWYCEDERFA